MRPLAYFKRLRELQPQALIVVAGTNPAGESTVLRPDRGCGTEPAQGVRCGLMPNALLCR